MLILQHFKVIIECLNDFQENSNAYFMTWATLASTSVDAFNEITLLACYMLRWQILNKHLAEYVHRISRS